MGQIHTQLARFGVLCLRLPLLSVVTVAFGLLSLLGSIWDPNGDFQHGCARAWARVVLFLSGVRLVVHGLAYLEKDRRYVLCANHQSYMDIPVLLASLPFQFRFVAKKELFQIPFLGWYLRKAGHYPVDRENPVAAMRALGPSVDQIREGVPVVFFPEGRISRDGGIAPFKSGAFSIGQRSGAEIVPITIHGTRIVLQPGSKCVHGGRVVVTIDSPVASNTMLPSRAAIQVREIILSRFLAPQ